MPVESQATSAFQLPFHSVSSRPFDRCVTPITASQPSPFVNGLSPVFYATHCTTSLTSRRGLTRDSVSRYHIAISNFFTQCNVSYRGYFIDRSTQARNSCTRVLIVRTNCNEFTRKMNTSAWTPTFLAIGRSFNRFLPSYDTRFSSIATVNNRRNDISSLQSR